MRIQHSTQAAPSRGAASAGVEAACGHVAEPERLIEIGWLVVGRLDAVDRDAVEEARRRTRQVLERQFPGFRWEMPRVERRDVGQEVREEPVGLLEDGRNERDARHWDFALVVTGADLVAREKPYVLAVPSRALGVGVVSTVRIDPRASGDDAEDGDRGGRIAQRLFALALHLVGHLNGLDHSGTPACAMHEPSEVTDLDAVEGYEAEAAEELGAELADVADLRLEERRPRRSTFAFYLQATLLNLDDVASGVRRARPWLFPLRLGRLTTAALSALVILLMTAETWDLALNQSPGLVIVLAAVVLVATTGYLVHRQRLLVSRGSRRLTEQSVVTNVSLVLTVLLGLTVTFAGLLGLAMAAARWLYPPDLVAGWAPSVEGRMVLERYVVLAGFVAALGLVIGSLGASFEEENYIRHIAYVDEEV
jgi:hypothetical protein